MFAYMLHRWKFIALVAILGMVTIGGFLLYRQYNSIQNKYGDATYNEMIKDMTQEQLRTVDLFYTRYRTYQERIKENQFYADNSLMMKLDANNVSILTKEYLIKSSYSGVVTSFIDSSLDLDDYKKMATALSNDLDARYVNELITLSGSVNQDAYMIDTDKVGDVLNGSIDYSYTGVLTLRATANNRDDAELLVRIADEAVKEHLSTLKGTGLKVDLSELTTTYTERYDTGIAEYQRGKAEQGSQLVTEYYNFETSAKNSMDQQESAVFNYLIEKEQEVKEQLHKLRYPAIGLVVGGVLAVIIVAIAYLFAPGVKTFDDVKRLTKEKCIGVVVQKTRSKIFLGKLFHNWGQKIEFHGVRKIPEDEAVAIVCDRIGSICADRDASKVFIVSDSEAAYTGSVITKTLETLKTKGIEAQAGSPSNSLESLQGLRGSQVAVLAVTMKNSLPNVVRDEYAVCEENNIPVVANFVVYPQK